MRKKKSLKSQTPTSSLISLSPCLVKEVLCRLSVKSLLKFRCVCKEWRSLIDSPNFASLHFTRFNTNKNGLNDRFFVVEDSRIKKRPKCLTRHNGTLTETSHLAMPKNWVSTLKFGYYANGLILFSRYDRKIGVLGFVLWNPSTRTCLEIPSHGNLYGKRDILTVLVEPPPTKGVNDYKLFVIALDAFYGRNRTNLSTFVIEVYCFNTGSWRSCSIDTTCVENFEYDSRTIASLNGVVHWIGRNPEDDSECIVAFDVYRYVVSYFGLPLARCHGFMEVSVVNGSLAVVLKSGGGYHDVWVMENYGADDSWVNHLKINRMFLYPLRNGKFFGITGAELGDKVYDIGSKKVMDLRRICNGPILLVDGLVETLVLPSGGVEEPEN